MDFLESALGRNDHHEKLQWYLAVSDSAVAIGALGLARILFPSDPCGIVRVGCEAPVPRDRKLIAPISTTVGKTSRSETIGQNQGLSQRALVASVSEPTPRAYAKELAPCPIEPSNPICLSDGFPGLEKDHKPWRTMLHLSLEGWA